MFHALRETGVVPVVTVADPEQGLRLCEALLAGNLPVAEFTFRTAAAEPAIRAAARRFPELVLGAGTVLTPEQVQRARDAGAAFAVAPGCNPAVVETARNIGLPFAPGVCTPSEVEQALQLDARVLKFFPAEQIGGVPVLKAMSAPYAHLGLLFCPTGGIDADNVRSYLELAQVAFAGGTWIAPKTLIREGQWAEISRRAAATRAIVEQVRSAADTGSGQQP